MPFSAIVNLSWSKVINCVVVVWSSRQNHDFQMCGAARQTSPLSWCLECRGWSRKTQRSTSDDSCQARGEQGIAENERKRWKAFSRFVVDMLSAFFYRNFENSLSKLFSKLFVVRPVLALNFRISSAKIALLYKRQLV